MKQFAYKLIVFFAIMVALDQATGAMMDRIYAGTVKGDYGRNNYIATGVHADCLIFGSSRAIHHYDPDRIGRALGMSCYNCGEDGMGIITMYGRFREITARYTPKVVIYDVVHDFDINEGDNSKYIGFLRFHQDCTGVSNIINQVDATERYKSLSRSYKYNSRFLDIASQRLSHDPSVAADFRYAPEHGEISYVVKDYVSSQKSHSVDSLKMACLERMIDDCQAQGIRFVVVISPFFHARDYVIYKPVLDLCENKNVLVLNHFTDCTFVDNPQLFCDQYHLNEKGVSLFDSVVCFELN